MTHRLSRRTAATTRFSPESTGCQKQMAPRVLGYGWTECGKKWTRVRFSAHANDLTSHYQHTSETKRNVRMNCDSVWQWCWLNAGDCWIYYANILHSHITACMCPAIIYEYFRVDATLDSFSKDSCNNQCTLCLRKKRGVELFAITSSTVNQFWQLFHCRKQQ